MLPTKSNLDMIAHGRLSIRARAPFFGRALDSFGLAKGLATHTMTVTKSANIRLRF